MDFLANGENKAQQKEYLICCLLLIVFVGMSMVPLFGQLFLGILLPACLVYGFVRFDVRHMALPVLLVLLLPMLFGLQFDLSVFVSCIPPAVALAYALRKKKSLLFVVSVGAAGELVAAALLFLTAMAAAGGLDALLAQLNEVTGVFESTIAEMMNAYQLPAEVGTMYLQVFTAILPAMILCMMASYSYIIFYLSNAVLKRRDVSYRGLYRPFSEIRADKSCVIAAVVFFIVKLFVSGIVASAVANIVIILVFFLFVCGFSVACFWVKRVQQKPFRVVLYILLFFTMPVTANFLVFLGLVDAFFNLRRLGTGQSPE